MAFDGRPMPLFDVQWHNTPLEIDSKPRAGVAERSGILSGRHLVLNFYLFLH